MPRPAPDPPDRPPDRTATKSRIVEAALQTLRDKGYAGASAREIARAGDLNQALIFYHFGSVKNLLLAALEAVSARRMEAYGRAFEETHMPSELMTLATRIYAEDLRNGYVTVLAEMVAAGAVDRELGAGVMRCLEPWIGLVERKLRALAGGSLIGRLLPARDLAHALISLYVGVDLLSHLDGDHGRAQSLLELAAQLAPLADPLIGPRRSEH